MKPDFKIKFEFLKNKNKMSKETKMKKMILTLAILASLVATSANAEISNLSCNSSSDYISFNYTNTYNHAWIYVNGNYIDDFWRISSGSSVENINNLHYGDIVRVLYSDNYGEGVATDTNGQYDAICE